MPGQMDERTEGWAEGRTDPIYMTLPATAGGPKSLRSKQKYV